MIAWVLWFFVVLHLFLLDGVLAGVSDLFPDMALAIALYCALYARPTALPGLLLCAAVSRSVLVDGGAALHLLILGIPVAVLLPMRALFSKISVLWPCLASGFLAFVMPRVAGLLYRVADDGVPWGSLTGLQIFVAVCLVPAITQGLRMLPPLSLLQEDRQ